MNPFDEQIDVVAASCIAVRLRALNRQVSALYDRRLRPLDLKISQLNVLVAAAKLGVARPADVCRHLCLDESTLSRNVERMRSRGWLETVPAEDARAQPFRLTHAGRRLLQKALPEWRKAQREAEQILSRGGGDVLRRAAVGNRPRRD